MGDGHVNSVFVWKLQGSKMFCRISGGGHNPSLPWHWKAFIFFWFGGFKALKPPNQKINKGFSTSEKARIRGSTDLLTSLLIRALISDSLFLVNGSWSFIRDKISYIYSCWFLIPPLLCSIQFPLLYSCQSTFPGGLWCQNDVASRRIDVNTTSYLRHVPAGLILGFRCLISVSKSLIL